jgi:hypothetical protein
LVLRTSKRSTATAFVFCSTRRLRPRWSSHRHSSCQPTAAAQQARPVQAQTDPGTCTAAFCIPSRYAGILLLFAACSSSEARRTRSLSAQQKVAAAAAVKQAPAAVVSFSQLQPTLTSQWIPSVRSEHPSVEVPVAGIAGTPSTPETMSRIKYTGVCVWGGRGVRARAAEQQQTNKALTGRGDWLTGWLAG